MAYTNIEFLGKLYEIRDEWIKSGKVMQKNITTSDGSSIFFRDLDQLNSWIESYEAKVANDESGNGYSARVYLHG